MDTLIQLFPNVELNEPSFMPLLFTPIMLTITELGISRDNVSHL
jgi:hypothetical protein